MKEKAFYLIGGIARFARNHFTLEWSGCSRNFQKWQKKSEKLFFTLRCFIRVNHFFLELKLYNCFKHTKHKSRWVLWRVFWTDLQWGEMNTVVGSPWNHYCHDLDFVWGFLCFVPCFVSYMFSEVLYRACFQSSTWYMATLWCFFLLLLLLVLPFKPLSSPSWTSYSTCWAAAWAWASLLRPLPVLHNTFLSTFSLSRCLLLGPTNNKQTTYSYHTQSVQAEVHDLTPSYQWCTSSPLLLK